MRVPPSVLGLLAGLSLGLCSCGGPTFDGRVYRGDGVAFRVGALPRGWHEIRVDGALLAFRDASAQATIAVNGRCGVDGDDVPLTALTHHLFLHFTDREVTGQKSITLDGREALATELVAELDGVPRRFIVYVLKKDGCVYDFVWIGAELEQHASSEHFRRFVQGFSTEI